MAANSNTGVPYGAIPSSVYNDNVFSLPSGARSSTGMLLPAGSSGGINSTTGMTPMGNSGGLSNMTGLVPSGSPTSGFLLDMVSGLEQDTGITVNWSNDEQSILEEGLSKYAEESNIMRYIKIAAALPEKTVRDVALRCRWMTDHLQKDKGKRRKLEEYCTGRKMKERKEKLMDSPLKSNMPPAPPPHMAAYSFMMHHVNQNNHLSCEGPSLVGAIRHLLDENTQVLNQITNNLTAFKMQENIDLLCHARSNITAILNDMRNMPGIMSRMSPLPVSLNEELASIILPSTSHVNSQASVFGTPGSIYLKQEPR